MENQTEQPKRGDRWLFYSVFFLFLCGIGVRGYAYFSHPERMRQAKTFQNETSPRQPPNISPQAQNESQMKVFSPDDASAAEPDLLTDIAPYLTEGGLSFFLGFCLGYFLRLVARTAILIVGALYCGLILLSHYGMITVDWGLFQQTLQQLLLNTKTQVEGLRGVLTVGVPSMTMAGLGIWRGLKKS